MGPSISIHREVNIITLIHSTPKSISASSLQRDDIVEIRSFGNCTAKVRIRRGEDTLKFGVKIQENVKIDTAINMINHEELNFFNPQSKITENFVIETIISLFPSLWFRGELLPGSNSYLAKYQIFDVMQVEKPN